MISDGKQCIESCIWGVKYISMGTSEIRTTSQQRTVVPLPMCPLFGGSTVHCSYEELQVRKRETTVVVISGFTAQVDRISPGCHNRTIYALVMGPDYLRYTRTIYASVNCPADHFRGRTISAATPALTVT